MARDPSEQLRCLTMCDLRFLPQVLALRESMLRAGGRELALDVLALEPAASRFLRDARLPGVGVLDLAELEADEPELRTAREGRTWTEYCWTITPVLCARAVERVPRDEVVAWFDADVVFLRNPVELLEEMEGASVLLVPHRYYRLYRGAARAMMLTEMFGVFNGGTIAFRHDADGLAAVRAWRRLSLEWCFARVEEGRFGNQNHLTDFPQRFGGVRTMGVPGGALGPWNAGQFELTSDGDGVVMADRRPVLSYHHQSLRLYRLPRPLRMLPRPFSLMPLPSPARGTVARTKPSYRLRRAERRHFWRPYLHLLAWAVAEVERGTGIVGELERLRFLDLASDLGVKARLAANRPWRILKAPRRVRRLVLRTSRSPLRRLWAAGYRATARAVALLTVAGIDGASAYVSGSIASGDPVYGLADIDLVVVVPDQAARGRVERRGQRLRGLVPPLAGLVPHLWCYAEDELEAVAKPFPTAEGASFLGAEPPHDPMGVLERPGLYGLAAGWRQLRGTTGVRRARGHPDRQAERMAAWLELQYRVRYLFEACLQPTFPHSASHAVSAVAEPARVWLWLSSGERVHGRRNALERALDRLPEERQGLTAAIELYDRLHRGPPAPLDELAPAGMRITVAVAELLAAELEPVECSEVRLLGPRALDEGVPLADWRSLAVPPVDDHGSPLAEALVLLRGDPGDVGALRTCAWTARSGRVTALRAGPLLVLPTAEIWGATRLRGLQCAASDPVTFALLDDLPAARFPEVSGWAARDVAGRAVTEHRAWLAASDGQHGAPPGWVGHRPSPDMPVAASAVMLVSAVRAALFLDSVEAGEPRLALTLAAAVDELAFRDPRGAAAAREVLTLAPRDPPRELMVDLCRAVCALPPYAGLLPTRAG